MPRLVVLGAGSWGTALALQLARGKNDVILWAHRAETRTKLQNERENRAYLAGYPFPANLFIAQDLAEEIPRADAILIVVPSHAFQSVLTTIAPFLGQIPVLWAIKGFANSDGALLSDVFRAQFSTTHPHAILAGPSFAREVAQGQPTAVTIAGDCAASAETFARYFHSSNFHCYTGTDCIGVQVGGAVKNVIAIATGIADGLGCGANARAALITRGLHEMKRLATAMGGQGETLMGLAGLGDLVLTCTDDQSRNRRFGLGLGRGKDPLTLKKSIGQVIEGEGTTHDTHALAQRLGIRMPITSALAAMLSGESPLHDAVCSFLQRPIKPELS